MCIRELITGESPGNESGIVYFHPGVSFLPVMAALLLR